MYILPKPLRMEPHFGHLRKCPFKSMMFFGLFIRATYQRHIRLIVNGRPTPPSGAPSPGSISETDRVEGNPLDGWYYDTASFTANPYYQFDGPGIGEWHRDYNC